MMMMMMKQSQSFWITRPVASSFAVVEIEVQMEAYYWNVLVVAE